MICLGCAGSGGKVEVEVENGVTRQTWRPCGACNGSGVRR